MWKLDHKEGWAPKNWYFQIVVLEKTLESSLDCKEIKPVHPKGNQPWIFIGRTDTEASILWPPDVKSRFIGKDSDAGTGLGQEEKRMIKDEIVGGHHRLNGHEFEPTLGDSKGFCTFLLHRWKRDTSNQRKKNEDEEMILLRMKRQEIN